MLNALSDGKYYRSFQKPIILEFKMFERCFNFRDLRTSCCACTSRPDIQGGSCRARLFPALTTNTVISAHTSIILVSSSLVMTGRRSEFTTQAFHSLPCCASVSLYCKIVHVSNVTRARLLSLVYFALLPTQRVTVAVSFCFRCNQCFANVATKIYNLLNLLR